MHNRVESAYPTSENPIVENDIPPTSEEMKKDVLEFRDSGKTVALKNAKGTGLEDWRIVSVDEENGVVRVEKDEDGRVFGGQVTLDKLHTHIRRKKKSEKIGASEIAV